MNRIVIFLVLAAAIAGLACRRSNSEYVTVALPESFSSLDTLTSTSSDSAAERVRNLMFNSLIKKNDKFEYIGELASNVETSEDGQTITLTLRENVKFHNGKQFTSADVKYTFEKLFESNGYKSGAFFDTENGKRVAHIAALETPDEKTVIFYI